MEDNTCTTILDQVTFQCIMFELTNGDVVNIYLFCSCQLTCLCRGLMSAWSFFSLSLYLVPFVNQKILLGTGEESEYIKFVLLLSLRWSSRIYGTNSHRCDTIGKHTSWTLWGKADRNDYTFITGSRHHLFCSKCSAFFVASYTSLVSQEHQNPAD